MARGTFQPFTAKTEIAPSAAQQTKLFLEYSIHWSFVFPFIQHAWHALFFQSFTFPVQKIVLQFLYNPVG
jgi:hypothetical protein